MKNFMKNFLLTGCKPRNELVIRLEDLDLKCLKVLQKILKRVATNLNTPYQPNLDKAKS